MSNHLRAHHFAGRRRLKTYGSRRICRAQGCATKLSKYNRNTECHLHAPKRFPRTRGKPGQPTR